jgi:hypothetical protein
VYNADEVTKRRGLFSAPAWEVDVAYREATSPQTIVQAISDTWDCPIEYFDGSDLFRDAQTSLQSILDPAQ